MTPALNKPRTRVFLICLLVIALAMPGISAFAQNPQQGLAFTLSVEPASLTAPGEVTVTARVSNAGATDINTPLSLYDPDSKLVTAFSDGGSLPRLQSGGEYIWQGKYKVSQNQLDEGKLIYTLRYNTQDSLGAVVEQNLPATATLTFTGEKVDLKVIRTITPEVVRRGKDVTVLYELVNQGNVKLTNITVRENRLISTRTQEVASIEPGQSAKVTFTKTNVTGDLSSSALINYRKEGDRSNLQLTVDAVEVPLARPALQFSLTSDKTQFNIGETAILTLELKNAGNITYSNVTVTDPILGEVFTNVQIDPGQTKQLQKEVAVNETTTYAFTLKLEDNTGASQEEKVPELKVSAYAEGQMLRLNLTLTASSDTIHALPGDITFHLTVTNDSNTAAKNINISHANTRIYTINELAPGQSRVITRDFSLSQSGEYRFTAVADDVQENPVTFESNTLVIGYAPPTPVPTREIIVTIAPAVTHSPVPADFTPGGGPVKTAHSILSILMVAFGILFALALILLVVSAIMRARARAKSNAAYDAFELAGARDYNAEPEQANTAVQTQEPEAPETATETVFDVPEEMPHEKYLRAKSEGEKPADAAPLAADEEGAFRLTREAQKLEDAAAETVEGVQEKAAEAVQDVRETVEETVEKTEETVEKAEETAGELAEEAQHRSRRTKRYKDGKDA